MLCCCHLQLTDDGDDSSLTIVRNLTNACNLFTIYMQQSITSLEEENEEEENEEGENEEENEAEEDRK